MAIENACQLSLFENSLYVRDQKYYSEYTYLHTIKFSI